MNILRTMNGDTECRIEDAIYFSDGRVLLLSGDPQTGYTAQEWTTFNELEKKAPNKWGVIYEMHTAEEGKYIAQTGETSWGGAGFVALYDKEKKEHLWVLHLNECNNFESISINNGFVIAISDYSFPNGTEFRLPLESPELVEVSNL